MTAAARLGVLLQISAKAVWGRQWHKPSGPARGMRMTTQEANHVMIKRGYPRCRLMRKYEAPAAKFRPSRTISCSVIPTGACAPSLMNE
jgi:hypothetical protein